MTGTKNKKNQLEKDVKYLANYKPSTLYTNPVKPAEEIYVNMLSEQEEVLDEQEECSCKVVPISEYTRLAITVSWSKQTKDFVVCKITYMRRLGYDHWEPISQISLNEFHLSHLRQFLDILNKIKFNDAAKTKIAIADLKNVDLSNLISSSGEELIKLLAGSSHLTQDIYALNHKRKTLEKFEIMLADKSLNESSWQNFFEDNTWIFGHGLSYIFLHRVNDKLETTTTGEPYKKGSKRVDALMQTAAEISQCVLIEIKKPSTPLLKSNTYRTDCWDVSIELSGAVTQIQKTTFEFTSNKYEVDEKDSKNPDSEEVLFKIHPKSYLVIGDLKSLKNEDGTVHHEKFKCFELYRHFLNAPDILTFDELYERAKCIVETISEKY